MQTCWCFYAPVGIWELGSFTYHFKTSDLSRTWHQAWMGGHIKPSVAIGECPLKSSESKMCKTRALGWMESFRACRSSGVDDDEPLWPCPHGQMISLNFSCCCPPVRASRAIAQHVAGGKTSTMSAICRRSRVAAWQDDNLAAPQRPRRAAVYHGRPRCTGDRTSADA